MATAYEFKDFCVKQIDGAGAESRELLEHALSFQSVLYGSWSNALVPSPIHRDADVKTLYNPKDLGLVANQATKLRHPNRSAEYFIGYDLRGRGRSMAGAHNAASALRIEKYRSRAWPLRLAYPNITAFEVIDGNLRGKHEHLAASMLFFGLRGYKQQRPVIAHVAQADENKISWMNRLGFEIKKAEALRQQVGASEMVVSRLAAPAIGRVSVSLLIKYPFLGQASRSVAMAERAARLPK